MLRILYGGGGGNKEKEKLNSRTTYWCHRILVNALVFPVCLQLISRIPNGNWYLPVGIFLTQTFVSFLLHCSIHQYLNTRNLYGLYLILYLQFISYDPRLWNWKSFCIKWKVNFNIFELFMHCNFLFCLFVCVYLHSCWLGWLSSKTNNR